MPLLDEPLLEMDTTFSLLISDILKYYYYGGMAYLGMERYKKAFEFFKMAMKARPP